MALANTHKGVFRDNFNRLPRNAIANFMTTTGYIYIPEQTNDSFDVDTGEYSDKDKNIIWRGKANIDPNMLWRTRERIAVNEMVDNHAYTVHCNLEKNYLFEENEFPIEPVKLKPGYIFVIESNVANTNSVGEEFVIRSTGMSSFRWLTSIICYHSEANYHA